ncbi:MAG: tRNA (adenosine(37)-N6)-threonylcarbamoyltransferase complex dimerization subunit type 1 TsaB [Armatimonadetes bacterium]|nr:tRNA (adenosine(37)-N6)-threonylcarbamoyltransferase complex dimerization subunit type 1 TsaB [Armatimonadota bacterium]
MRVLAIETATTRGGVALVDAGGALAERAAYVPGQHLEWLVGAIAATLAEAGADRDAVEGLAVSLGPGGFTSLRIGLMTACAWAQTAGRPLVGVSTLDAIAAGIPIPEGRIDASAAGSAGSGHLVLAAVDARRGEIAAALFRRTDGLQRLTADLVVAPEHLRDRLPPIAEPVVVAGDALEQHRETIVATLAPWAGVADREHWWPRASVTGTLGRARLIRGERDDPLRLVPRYARRLDAREFAG